MDLRAIKLTGLALVAMAGLPGCVSHRPQTDALPPVAAPSLATSQTHGVSPDSSRVQLNENIELIAHRTNGALGQDHHAGQHDNNPRPAQPDAEAGHHFQPPPAGPDALLQAPHTFAPDMNSAASLTVAAVEGLALTNNPTLIQAQNQIQGELGKAIQAGLFPNPSVSYVQEQIGVEGTAGEFVGGTVQQQIVTANKLDLSRQKYLARTEAAEWHALAQQYRVLNDVRIHYFVACGQSQLVQIHRELLKSAEDGVLTARERYNVGQATQADVHLANIALQRAQLDLMMAENDFAESFAALQALVGAELPPTSWGTPLEANVAPVAWDDAISQLVSTAPQILAARSKLASDRVAVRRERVEPIPDLMLEGGVGHNFEVGSTVAVAGVTVEVPLFDYNQGTIRQAEADYARQQAEVRRIELELKRELAKTYRDYMTALQHVTAYQQTILPGARAAYELQLQSYQENRLAWVDVLRVQQNYFMLQAEYVRRLIDWRRNEVLVNGYLLHGGLTAPTAPPPPGHIDAIPKPR